MTVRGQVPQPPQAMGTSDGMVWIPGATFTMGSDHHYPEEAPARPAVGGLWIDLRPVTNREFGRFVGKTGYVTVAERTPDPADYPGARPEMLVPFSVADGYQGKSPVGVYPANGYGLYDMIGNVWEWTSDWYAGHAATAHACCTTDKRDTSREQSIDRRDPARIPRKVMKGGSHLCAPNCCRRYRPAARMAQPIDTSTSHLGLRLVLHERSPSEPSATR